MEIYVLRHGAAADRGPGGIDSARELTDEGRAKTAAVMKIAKRADVEPSIILSSPYARAIGTAKIAARELGYQGNIVETEALLPESTPEAVWNELRGLRGEASILLAGHEPLFSALVAYLLASPSLSVEMKKSALVRIDVEGLRAAPQGTLRWMITPALAM